MPMFFALPKSGAPSKGQGVITFFINGLLLATAAGIQPGPFQTYIINTAFTVGWRRGLPVIFAPLIVDGPIILTVVFLFGALPEAFIHGIRVAGGLLLLWIAWGSLTAFRAGTAADAALTAPASKRGLLGKAVAMNLLSPGPYLFWSTVNGPLLVDALALSPLHGLAFLLGFYGTFLLLLLLTLILFDRLGRLDPRLTRGALLITAVIMALFGIGLLVQGVSGLAGG